MGFLNILNNLHRYREEIPFKRWIRKIIINVLINEYKRKQKEKEKIVFVDYYPEVPSMIELNGTLSAIETQELLMLIMKLPPMSQKVFNLSVIDGYQHSEIAKMLGISEGTSKWHLHSAREKLRELLHAVNHAEPKNKVVTPARSEQHPGEEKITSLPNRKIN